MYPPATDYDAHTLSLRNGLFECVAYVQKEDRLALLEAASVFVFEKARASGRTEVPDDPFLLAGKLAQDRQRVHAVAGVLVKTALEDMRLLPADDDELLKLLSPVGAAVARHVDTAAATGFDARLACCREQINEAYREIIEAARSRLLRTASYLKAEEVTLLNQACDFGIAAHSGQFRNGGLPYITHPMAVATQLAEWHIDIQGLCAGVLHDVLEDTGTAKVQLIRDFGETIADMVDGLSKLEKLEYNDQEEAQAESFRKLILAMTKDIRIIIVKLSDRLHNMRTLSAKKPESRRRIALETLEIYAQLANRIGLNHVYRELQDLAFMHLHPQRYQVLQRALLASRRNRHDVVGKVLRTFSQGLVGGNIEAQIKGREKNLFSIHQKMQAKNLHFADVMDIYGFRVIVNSIPSCYAALGVLHTLYKPKPGKIKDYIAIPKNNGYQSLHTTLVGPYGLPIEVQIRTREMDAVAEEGIAGHWMYKSGGGSFDQAQVRTHQWLQTILDLQAHSDSAMEFLEHVKIDLFPNEVYIFTPKGKIMVLPEGATPIDFAYAVHTDVGNRTVAARINHNMMPLRTKLRTGDSVEIITSEQVHPNPAWLSFAVTGRARSAIRSQIKHMNRTDAVKLGENLLQKALSSLLPENVLLSESVKNRYLEDLAGKNIGFEDVLYDVGMGRLQPVSVAMHLAELAGEHFGGEVRLSPIKVSGNETGRVHLAKCCNPIPGDAVKALLVQGQGIIIHRDNCPNILKTDPEQQLDAGWDTLRQDSYHVGLQVVSQDMHGLLATVAQSISANGANIESVETPSKKQDGIEGFIEFRFALQVKDLDQLTKIMRTLHSIPQIRKVVRL